MLSLLAVNSGTCFVSLVEYWGGGMEEGREKIVDPVLFPATVVASSWRRRPVGAGEVGLGEESVLDERD
ncbi:hypothetical protein AgCh_004134 [Apium graveolens]